MHHFPLLTWVYPLRNKSGIRVLDDIINLEDPLGRSMIRSDANGRRLRFGVFELDPASTELTKNGSQVRLQDQPARLLLHLLEHRGELVTREQLQSALWPEDTFVDFAPYSSPSSTRTTRT